MPSSRIVGSYGGFIPSFLRNLYTVFHSVLYQFTLQEGSLFPHPLQHLLFVDFSILAILFGMGWYFTVFLICIFLIMNYVEHLFICLLAICMSSLEKCLFSSLAHLLIEFFILLMVKTFVSCFICYYFLPFWRLPFHLAYSFLHCAKASKFH